MKNTREIKYVKKMVIHAMNGETVSDAESASYFELEPKKSNLSAKKSVFLFTVFLSSQTQLLVKPFIE